MKKDLVCLLIVTSVYSLGYALEPPIPDVCEGVTCPEGMDGPYSTEVCFYDDQGRIRIADVCYCMDLSNPNRPFIRIQVMQAPELMVLAGWEEMIYNASWSVIRNALSEQYCASMTPPCPAAPWNPIIQDQRYKCYEWRVVGTIPPMPPHWPEMRVLRLTACEGTVICVSWWRIDCEWDGIAGCCLADAYRVEGGAWMDCPNECPYAGCPELPDYPGEPCPLIQCPY